MDFFLKSFTTFVLIANFILACTATTVFVEQREASSVLQRFRRANSGFLEELKQGNLERECLEEICDYEEAREVFEDNDKTNLFWQNYPHRDPCLINPCRNNGTCLKVGTSFTCQCPGGYEGKFCQTVFESSLGCYYRNGLCQHFCNGSGEFRHCSCADGYLLSEHGRDCIANEEFPCGQIPAPEVQTEQSSVVGTRAVGSGFCPQGQCPWQVLIQLKGSNHCGGALISSDWVITAAHCIHGNNPADLTVVAGEYTLDVEEGEEQRFSVSAAFCHPDYSNAPGDSDVALLRLAAAVNRSAAVIPICLPTAGLIENELLRQSYFTVSGWGRRTAGGNGGVATASSVMRRLDVRRIANEECGQAAGFNISHRMLCAGYMEGAAESCKGDDGSPLVATYNSANFLLGVVGWGRGCARRGYYAVYANMVHFLDWVKDVRNQNANVMTDIMTPEQNTMKKGSFPIKV